MIPNDLYGGTYRLVDKVLTRWGLNYTMVDQTDLTAVEAAVNDDTKLIWVETPTNPTLNIVDIEAIIARKRKALVVVDNTFATPIYQRPLELGADAVIHCTTKYIGGHSDAVGGAAIVREQALHDAIRFVQNSVGAVPGPLDCFLSIAASAPCTCVWRRTPPTRRRYRVAPGPRDRRPLARLQRHGLVPARERDGLASRCRSSASPNHSAGWSR